ncbi:MAG TPA: hypothetical protein VMD97_10785 [Candidatus Aquilonibacter sp.]|nr:hypothetical protein [Candidatus Aquilonibacter sp.]
MNANVRHTDAIDHNIHRALSALRDARPRSGLNGRILISLEHRAATRATHSGGLPFHSFIVKGWGIARGNARRPAHVAVWSATAAAIVAMASLVTLHHRATAPAQTGSTTSEAVILSEHSESKNHEAGGVPTSSEPFSTTNHILAEPTRRVARPASATMPAGCVHSGCTVHDNDTVADRGTTPSDAQLLADLHAPSHPAPPLPLTPEEKLLLRGLRDVNLTELAELNPEFRARQDADETTAFKNFFPDPPPLKQPLGDTE